LDEIEHDRILKLRKDLTSKAEKLKEARDEIKRLQDRLHALETASWADAVMECEAWKQRALVAEAALKELRGK